MQRKFLVTEEQLTGKIGITRAQLDEIKARGMGTPEASPDSHILMPEKTFDLPSRGQYLHSDNSWLDFSIYPRADDVIAKPANPTAMAKMTGDLKGGKVKSGFRTQRTVSALIFQNKAYINLINHTLHLLKLLKRPNFTLPFWR